MSVINSNIGKYGRLGNMLFQISAVIGIAIKNNMEYEFAPWYCEYTKKGLQKYFKTALPEILYRKAYSTYTEKNFNYEDVVLDKQLNHDLHGYFQSRKYWEHCEDVINKYFEPAKWLVEDIEDKYGEILSKRTCSIHVRRGDFVNNKAHDFCNMDYYNKAIGRIMALTDIDTFVVFSDNVEWCEKNFPKEFIFIQNNLSGEGSLTIHRKNDSDVEELFLQSMCKHQIISNSSYSWWSSYLNKNPNKIIIAPKKWLSDEYNCSDIYTDNMVKL